MAPSALGTSTGCGGERAQRITLRTRVEAHTFPAPPPSHEPHTDLHERSADALVHRGRHRSSRTAHGAAARTHGDPPRRHRDRPGRLRHADGGRSQAGRPDGWRDLDPLHDGLRGRRRDRRGSRGHPPAAGLRGDLLHPHGAGRRGHLPGARRGIPGLRADHRVRGRDPDHLPVRAHAGAPEPRGRDRTHRHRGLRPRSARAVRRGAARILPAGLAGIGDRARPGTRP